MSASSAGREFYEGSIRDYLNEAPTLPYMDLLARRSIAGSGAAKRELCGHLAGIAEALSAKYGPAAYSRGLERDDLRQEAMCAMLEALPRWDPSKMAFRSYAYQCARFAVLDALNLSHAISMPAVLAGDISAARREAGGDHGALVESVKRKTRLTRKAAEATIAATIRPSSMHARSPGEDGDTDPLARAWLTSIDMDYERVLIEYELRLAFRRARNMLLARERRALEMRYGVGGSSGEAGATFREIAEELDIGDQGAKVIVDRALAKLRAVTTRKGAA